MRRNKGIADTVAGRIARLSDEWERISPVFNVLPVHYVSHFQDAFTRLGAAFLAGGMEARQFGANVAELTQDADSVVATEERRMQAGRREFVQRSVNA